MYALFCLLECEETAHFFDGEDVDCEDDVDENTAGAAAAVESDGRGDSLEFVDCVAIDAAGGDIVVRVGRGTPGMELTGE
jgi:hypothetical protein